MDEHNYREQKVGTQIEEYIRVRRAPIVDDCCLFNGQAGLRPREVREQLTDLLVCAQFAGDESARPQWIRHGRHNQGHDAWIEKTTGRTKNECMN